MPFNTILGPTKLNLGTSDTDPATYPAVTALSDGSFAVAHEVSFRLVPQIVTEVFDSQGQLVQETVATPLAQSSQFETDVTGLAGGGYALAWTEPVCNARGTFGVFGIFTDVYDNAGKHVCAPVSVDPAPATVNLTVPELAPLSGGGHVVSWLIPGQGGSTDPMAAVFKSAGQQAPSRASWEATP